MEVQTMKDYKDLYFKLFNEITDTIEKLKEIQSNLENVQCETEEIYINSSLEE